MRVRIQSSKINGSLTPPSSKSMMQRALAAAALSKGTTIIQNPCKCEDADAATGIINKMGAEVSNENNTLRISNKQSSSPSGAACPPAWGGRRA